MGELEKDQRALYERSMESLKIPLGELKYLYAGTSRFEEDLAYYGDILGAEKIWQFEEFGAKVAAFRVAAGPLLLIADHRPAPRSRMVRATCSVIGAATSSRCSETSGPAYSLG